MAFRALCKKPLNTRNKGESHKYRSFIFRGFLSFFSYFFSPDFLLLLYKTAATLHRRSIKTTQQSSWLQLFVNESSERWKKERSAGLSFFFPLQLFALRWKIVIHPARFLQIKQKIKKRGWKHFFLCAEIVMCNALKAEPVVVTWCQSSPEIGVLSELHPFVSWVSRPTSHWISILIQMKWRKFLRRKKKEEKKKKEFISRNRIQGFVMASSLLSHPDAVGFLLWVTNNGVEEEMLIIKKFSKESAISSSEEFLHFEQNANSCRFFKLKK